MKKRTVVLLVIFLLLAVGGYIAYTMYDERTPDIVNGEPDVAIDAASLLAAFEKDTAAAKSRFLDKVVQVKGTVKSIDTTGAIVLGDEGTPSEVVIGLDRRHLRDFEKLKIGNTAILQGVCSGYTMSNTDPEDMLSGLGTTVQFRSAGVKE